MTIQMADFMYLGKKRYILIDVEAGRQIIDCADFTMPAMPAHSEIVDLTACCRRYTAEYYVLRKVLYGERSHLIFTEDENFLHITSQRTFINYTGSCIIAYGGGRFSDHIDTYLDYDEALELYFEQGILKEIRSLVSAILKFRAAKDTHEYKNVMEPYERACLRQQLAREALKSSYDMGTYRWRGSAGKGHPGRWRRQGEAT